jgi:aryl-alcohol dehydrogenase-like predicted oxidoreductase
MHYRQLGNSDLHISVIGMGCMSLPVSSEAESIRILNRAFSLGINFFDTADLYAKGLNETIVGKAFQDKRDKVILATKVGNQWRPDGSGWDWNPGKAYILDNVEKSLKRLGTDYIDLYQLHGGTMEDPINESIEAFELLKKQGKIRFYGISSIRPNVIREYVRRSSIVSVMTQYSLADRRPEESVLPLLFENRIGVLCRGVLGQGMLVNKSAKEYLGYSKDDIHKLAHALHNIAGEGRTTAQAAIQFVMQNPAVTTAVAGVSRIVQLEEIADTPNRQLLSHAEISALGGVLPPNHYEQHR